MQTLQSIKELVSQIKFQEWDFNVGLNSETPYLQITFMDACHFGGEPEKQHCRKWMLSYHMTDSEVVQTAFKAVLTALEHEARELFSYKGEKIFQPHFDLNFLVEFAKKKRVSVRPKVKSVDTA